MKKKPMETKLCACGCGSKIIFKEHHRWRNIKYIQGHNPIWNKGIKIDRNKFPKMGHFKKQSEKSKEIIGMKNRGKIRSEESKKKISKNNAKYWLGKHHSKETKEKIRLNHYPSMNFEENRKKVSEKLKGKIPKNLYLINKDKFGKNNPMWMGGLSLRGYKNWNRKIRHSIRQRDNFICMICRKHQEKENKSLCVHHINYDKELSIKENLITLCSECHHKTNINRKYWINFLQCLLSEKYGYSYSENKPIITLVDNLEVLNEN